MLKEAGLGSIPTPDLPGLLQMGAPLGLFLQSVIIFITYFSVNCFSHPNESFRDQRPGMPCSSLWPQPASRAVATTLQDHSRMHSLGTAWLQTPSIHLEELRLNLSCQECGQATKIPHATRQLALHTPQGRAAAETPCSQNF